MKRMRTMLLAAALLVLLAGVQLPAGAAGDGSRFLEEIGAPEPGYTEISTAEELAQITKDPDGYYVLTQDIDLSGYENWDPICKSTPFKGVLDGQGHVIRNLTVTRPKQSSYPYAGLFGRVSGGTIKNLGVEQAKIEMTYIYPVYAGTIAGSITGESVIENCYGEGSIYAEVSSYGSGTFSAGGLVGQAYGNQGQTSTIRSCYSRTTLTTDGRDKASLGGILGVAEKGGAGADQPHVLLQNCVNLGAVQNSIAVEGGMNNICSGGLIGTVQNCTVQIRSSANRGPVTAKDLYASDWEYDMSNYAYAGGLVGLNSGAVLTISDCYSSGDVLALDKETGAYAGGLIGGSDNVCTVERCYVSGAVTAENLDEGTDYACGLVGYNTGVGTAVKDCFVLTGEISSARGNAWTVCTPGVSCQDVWVLAPVPGGITDNATGTVTAGEAGQQATYAAAGWSFDGADAPWRMEAGSPYPVLSREPDGTAGQPVLQGQPRVVNLSFSQEGIAPNVGNTLYADLSDLTTDQGKQALGTVSIQWMKGDRAVDGAVGNTYQLPTGSKSGQYSVRVTASGCVGTAYSEWTLPVEDRLMLLGTVKIDNPTPKLGDVLHVDVSGLESTKGPVDPSRLKYEWCVQGSFWAESTSDSYLVGGNAVGKGVYVRISVSGSENTMDSAVTQPVGLPDFAGGTGTEEDPYQISSVEQWILFAYRVGYQNHIGYRSACYELMADLDFPQTTAYSTLMVSSFSGVLDGNGHALRNLTLLNLSGYGTVGLFSEVTKGGTIRNLHLENIDLTTNTDGVGGLVGLLQDGALSNCTVSGSVKTEHDSGMLGGLVCQATNSRIEDCRNYVALSGTDSTGGIVAQASNCTLERVYNYADISEDGGYGAGGIVGGMSNGGSISQAVNCGAVSSKNVYNTGGIVGRISSSSSSTNKVATLDQCTNLGAVSGGGSMVSAGGIVGAAECGTDAVVNITNSVNSGRVYLSTAGKIGGILGQFYDGTLTVKNCANTGQLHFAKVSSDKYAGGVVGYIMYSNAVLVVENCYVTGFPTMTGSSYATEQSEIFGRLYGGSQYNIDRTFTNCYSNAASTYVDKNKQPCTYVSNMNQQEFADTLNANIEGQEGLLAWQLDGEVNGGYPSLTGQGSRILYADPTGVELLWSGAAPQAGADFVAAVYDPQGRLTAVSLTASSGSQPTRLLFGERAELVSGGTVKVFCLDQASQTPLRAALTYQIP
ncbi:GLUG motif-containing protein [Intestinimonas massiliensis (ex Afouda et al. 2020)]|uniref:GLUG motif-containing protein n=1 Tax=Intestinimonas massiliensis (ex Afouda et al. 2020) TaxID=1673721 RepID=UPI001031EB2C|nr:GLUG motif-containing protein [Intestinimonas massiliensis (ex Afouda et al. 2020)]